LCSEVRTGYREDLRFFEHVPPSLAPDISPDFQLRGFRVPCVLVSPFARRGVVSHAEYDHTSILRLIEWRWGLNALSVRDAQAANIGVELDFDHPILAAPEIVVPEMLYSPPCPI
jgi:phospholipase C